MVFLLVLTLHIVNIGITFGGSFRVIVRKLKSDRVTEKIPGNLWSKLLRSIITKYL